MEDILAGYKNANELCIQLISLATGILILSITFINDVLKKNPPTWALKASWGCFLFSIVCGIVMMMAVTGQIFKIGADPKVARSLMYKSDPEKIKAVTGVDDPEKVKAAMDEAVNTLTAAAQTKENVSISSSLQIISFLAGIVFLIIFGARVTMGKAKAPEIAEAGKAEPPTTMKPKKSPRSLRRN